MHLTQKIRVVCIFGFFAAAIIIVSLAQNLIVGRIVDLSIGEQLEVLIDDEVKSLISAPIFVYNPNSDDSVIDEAISNREQALENNNKYQSAKTLKIKYHSFYKSRLKLLLIILILINGACFFKISQSNRALLYCVTLVSILIVLFN